MTTILRLARRQCVLTLTLAAVALFTAFTTSAQHRHGDLGQVDFAISCNDAAQQHFDTGLALLHHMMYEQAEEEFLAAADADADCAMAHWGIAMAQLHPLWDPPTEQALARGRAAVEQGKVLAPPTERERGWLEAIGAYFHAPESLGHNARLAEWEAAQKAHHEAHPEDIDAGAFYALARLATAPRDDREFSNQAEAGELLETLLARAPAHPGLFHYTIHAYDNPVLAERGVEVAQGYDRLAPEVPHALHMPSHIFVRLGMWPEVASWNVRSAEAALAQPVGEATSMHHVHALDYLVYAHLQEAKDAKARDVLGEIASIDNYQDSFGAAYGIAAAQARLPLERAQWEDAAKLPVRSHDDFPWDRYPWAEAITYFARGLGAARSGDVAAAAQAIEALDVFHDRTVEAGDTYWSVHVDAQRTTIAAWIAYSEGRHDEALALMHQAADTEDSVDKHPVTPGAVLPARELLGEMLLEQGDAVGALEAYEASLAISPGRSNALLGAGRAAELAGERRKAERYYRRAMEMTAGGDGERPGLAYAAAFMAAADGA